MERKKHKGYLALLVAYIIFGINIPISKYVLSHEIGAFALTFYRMMGAAVLFWLVSAFTKSEKVPGRDIFMFFLAGMCGILINQLCFVWGLSLGSPVDISVITTLVPIVAMILAAFFLREPITWKKAGGVMLGASGALLLILSGKSLAMAGGSMAGSLLALASVVSFAVYLTAFKRLITTYSVVTLMKWMFLFAAVCSLPFCWRDLAAVDYAGMGSDIRAGIFYVVFGATFISYFLVPVGQKVLRPTVVGMFNYLQPIIASLVAVSLGQDTFGWIKALAAILVFTGVYLVTQSKSRAQMDMEQGAADR